MEKNKFFQLIISLMFLLLLLGLFKLQIIQGAKYRVLSDRNTIRLLPRAGARGKILDCNGEVIVDNRLFYDLVILPRQLKEPEKMLGEIARILGIETKVLISLFNKHRFSTFPLTFAENISIKEAIALEELKNSIPAIIIQPCPKRDYPYGNLACHLLGYIGEIDRWRLTKLAEYGYMTKDLVGFGGVEEKYDYYLRQEEGGSSVVVDNVGRYVRLLGFRPPKNGKDLRLTIDLRIQKIVEQFLETHKGSVIIMDPHSGAIKAMASSPGFNAEVFTNRQQLLIRELFNDQQAPLLNRAISAAYPAGSLFKLIVATAALETGKINLNTSYNCQGSIYIGRQKFGCWDTHHEENLLDAIAHSCNVFFYRVGILTQPQTIHDYALKFGLAKVTGIDLPYEISGFIPSPIWKKIYKFKKWYDGDTANLSIGQAEVMVTPLQMASLLAVFANGGYLVSPYITESVDGKDIASYRRKRIKTGINTDSLELINRGMRRAISDPQGTGFVLSDSGVEIAGKTGTAQAPPGEAHGWFFGFFPYKKPSYVICVFLERSGAGYYSSLLARSIIVEMIKESIF
ncbi:MAG: penicillin-binding protein 2 [Candidatus Omnitrophica bacterium]|nr:penicillin-binding protein 2 [Candidatus Omnitrophota bacterium]